MFKNIFFNFYIIYNYIKIKKIWLSGYIIWIYKKIILNSTEYCYNITDIFNRDELKNFINKKYIDKKYQCPNLIYIDYSTMLNATSWDNILKSDIFLKNIYQRVLTIFNAFIEIKNLKKESLEKRK